MIKQWNLPVSLEVRGTDYAIRSDYRAVLDILAAYNDPEYEADEKVMICLQILYVDWEKIPYQLWQEAYTKAVEFIDMGMKADGRKPTLMDWEQDAPIIIPAVNHVLGKEIRAIEYMHWWTFLGAYMEIGESLFSSVVDIRQKRAKRKKLEKHEQEFYRENRALIDLKHKETEEDKQRREALKDLFV